MNKVVVVFGGTGFVGSQVTNILSKSSNVEAISISRKGIPPPNTSNAVQWKQGDALEPASYNDSLQKAHAVVIACGSSPLPTFSQEAFDQQVLFNGTTCETVINSCLKQNVKRIVLVGATGPDWVPAGYKQGKSNAFSAAEAFARVPGNTAVVLKPSAISGTRYLQSGIGLPLWVILKPFSWIMGGMQFVGLSQFLIRQFPSIFNGVLEIPVSVENVAAAAVEGVLDPKYEGKGLVIVSNQNLVAMK